MPHLALAAIGHDRPGLVAAVAEVLVRHDANVEDSQMAVLRGHFAMTLVVAAPEGAEPALRSDLDDVAARLGLEAISLNPVADDAGARPVATHVVRVHGADHPGILAAVTAALAARAVNVCDLQTRLLSDDELYVMLIEVAVPAGADVEGPLAAVAEQQAVRITVAELDQDAL